MKENILIVAAHPDDDILGCGGFLAKNKDMYNFKVVFIAEGSTARFENMYDHPEKLKETIETRNQYAIDALSLFNIKDISFYNLPCGRLDSESIIDINKIIEKEIKKFEPQIILTHAEDDTNNDHRVVFRSIMMATRPGTFKNLSTVASFEVLSSSEWNYSKSFTPNYFENLTLRELNLKWKALKCYKSETRRFPHPRSEEGIKALARYRGMQSGFNYAESFKIIRRFSK